MERSRELEPNGMLCNHLEINSSTKKDHVIEKNMNKIILDLMISSNSNKCDEGGKLMSLGTEYVISQNILNFRF